MRTRTGSLLTKAALGVAAALALGNADAVGQDRIRIGWTSYPADLSVIADAIEGGRAAAEELGVELEFALAAGAVAQANAVDNLLAAGIDVLAINPEDSHAIGPSVRKANELGVPVVMWIGDNLGGGETVTLISSDEEEGGYVISQWAMERVGGDGRIALVQGTKAHQAGLLRENGFQRALKEFPAIELAAYGEGNWMRDRANAVASDMLTREPELEIIIALSDDMAAGVHAAAAAAGADVLVTGYNGSCEVLKSIWDGRIEATLYQGWRDIGAEVVETSVAIARGEEVPERIVMPIFVVDRALMEEALATGPGERFTDGLVTDVERAAAGCD